jgi:hypothetical protein
MDLGRYVEDVREQLAVAAGAGGAEARAVAERLVAPLDPALRLALLEALTDAAAEITRELAPGSVELRLRGREPSFAVTLPAAPASAESAEAAGAEPPAAAGSAAPDADSAGAAADSGDGAMTRINMRLPEQLKARLERAADREGISINAWLVRAVTVGLERGIAPRAEPTGWRGGQRYTGWAR